MAEKEGKYGDGAEEAQVAVEAVLAQVEGDDAAVTQRRQKTRQRGLGVDENHRGGVEGRRRQRVCWLVFVGWVDDICGREREKENG